MPLQNTNRKNKSSVASEPTLGSDTVEFLQELLLSAPVTIYHVNLPDMSVGSYVSPNIQENLGISFNLPTNPSDWFEYIHPDDKERVNREFQAWLQCLDTVVLRQEYRIRDHQGMYRWIADLAKKKIVNNEIVAVTGCLSNFTDTRIEHEQLEKIAAVSPGVIYQLQQSASGHFSFPYVSAKLMQELDLQPEDVHLSSAPVFNKLHPEDRELMLTTLATSQATMSSYEYDYRVIKNGEICWVRDNAVPERSADGAIIWSGVAIDITEQKKVEEELRQLSFTDTLTRLANRRHFLMETERLITSSSRHERGFSLLMYDLDHFKRVNDTFGHDIGDQVLQQVSEVVQQRIRACDLVARIGGEEFAVLLPDTEISAAQGVAEELRKSIESINFNAKEETFNVTVTFGVTSYKTSDRSPEDLLKRADKLLYQGKEGGRNQVVAAA